MKCQTITKLIKNYVNCGSNENERYVSMIKLSARLKKSTMKIKWAILAEIIFYSIFFLNSFFNFHSALYLNHTLIWHVSLVIIVKNDYQWAQQCICWQATIRFVGYTILLKLATFRLFAFFRIVGAILGWCEQRVQKEDALNFILILHDKYTSCWKIPANNLSCAFSLWLALIFVSHFVFGKHLELQHASVV